jgi:hypothetical protein
MLPQHKPIPLESSRKFSARFNGWIWNYAQQRRTRRYTILRQNPNLTLHGLYHKAEPYQLVFQNYLNTYNPKFQQQLMNNTSEFYSFNK